jgi:hypothetical protein
MIERGIKDIYVPFHFIDLNEKPQVILLILKTKTGGEGGI